VEKLVRDLIPDAMRSAGIPHAFRIATQDERLSLLFNKLKEESQELEHDRSVEELADVLDVLRAIQMELAVSDAYLEDIRRQKLASRGGFCAGIVLLLTDPP
jgi:predicted house-cleaning noncanonical NTP pyrophosphatase (MazG superfamily)